jgi:hypothetical protein
MVLKTEIINGVPFHVDEKGNVYVYCKDKSNSSPCIGKVDKEKNLTLNEDWQTTIEIVKWITDYRQELAANTVESIERARKQQTIGSSAGAS